MKPRKHPMVIAGFLFAILLCGIFAAKFRPLLSQKAENTEYITISYCENVMDISSDELLFTEILSMFSHAWGWQKPIGNEGLSHDPMFLITLHYEDGQTDKILPTENRQFLCRQGGNAEKHYVFVNSEAMIQKLFSSIQTL